jgi:acyl carrier protein
VTVLDMNGDVAQTPKEVIRRFLTERCEVAPERLTDDATLRDLDLDSMMLLEVMMEVEDRFGVKLGDLSLPPNPTLGDIAGCVERSLSSQRPA